jgi:protein-L-isoaspartate O-methyltransferase
VLEIGTGTGYNAAVLAEAGAIVTSVEIDPGLADAARLALDRAGYGGRVRVVTGDGEFGAPDGAPYDRVIVTASAHDVPYAWVEQTRDGGRIVLPYTGPHDKGALLVLAVWGGVAEGVGDGDAYFMPMRGQRLSQRELQSIPDRQNGTLRVRVAPGGQRTDITY